VPDFQNYKKNQAQKAWSDAGFTTQVQFQSGGQGNYVINYQSLIGGTIDPPNGCAAVITVGP
jgi:beta-lactam-binding protein with PASTA domain